MQIQLIIKGAFFDQIAAGTKTKEYRAMSNRNLSLFFDGLKTEAPFFKPITSVLFWHGYEKGRRGMVVAVEDLDVEQAEDDFWDIVVSLGDILEKRNFHT